MLRYIQRPETDPYYNLAAEEYLLKAATVDTFMTWRNEPSVIIGKHQNTLKEIDLSFIESNNLPVIRRITGGGTVYHDPGNINFSFIFINRKDNPVDFREFTKPVIFFLQNLGLNASFEGKNNINVDGLKVSGNSAHIFKNKVLYHGTLLFNSDLDRLEKAINGKEDLFKDKAVSSVRAKVVNIKDLLKNQITVEEFRDQFCDYIFKNYAHVYKEKLNREEEESIQKLMHEKYKSYQWNFGYSPDYEFNRRWISNKDEYTVRLKVKEGIIEDAEIYGPQALQDLLIITGQLIKGSFHNKKSIAERLNKLIFADEKEMDIVNQIMDHLF